MVRDGDRVKHYMIDQTPNGQYLVVGNKKLFRTLHADTDPSLDPLLILYTVLTDPIT